MLFDEFVRSSARAWNSYFNNVSEQIKTGKTDIGNRRALFPTMLLCTKTDNYYIAELLGSSETFSSLVVKRHVEPNINRYFNLFDVSEDRGFTFKLDHGEKTGLKDLILADRIDDEKVRSRFPFVQFQGNTVLTSVRGDQVPIFFGRNHGSAYFVECKLINTLDSAIRVKTILYAIVVNKGFTKQRYIDTLNSTLSDGSKVLGITAVNSEEAKRQIVAAQFSNIYLTNKLRETTIGEFLKAHPEILNMSLSTRRFITEPHLPWVEKGAGNGDGAINPDLLVERDDGFCDIYDLKTALLNKASLTKGTRSRRRFIDYVQEGISQLANYKEYFEFEKNRAVAFQKYAVKVSNPNLVLVVGSYENVNPNEIAEASRLLQNFAIIDYDTLMQLFFNARGADDNND